MSGAGLRRIVMVLFWGLFVAAGLGFLVVRARLISREVLAVLDARATALRAEADEAAASRARREEIVAEIEQERRANEGLLARMPCELALDEVIPQLRALLEPMGVTLRPDIGWRERRELYEEAQIPIVLPDRQGAEGEARTAVASLPRLVLFRPYGGKPNARVLVVLAYRCPTVAPELPAHRELIPDRDRVHWPFSGAVLAKEREIEELRARRDADADALRDALLLKRLREDRTRLAELLATLEGS